MNTDDDQLLALRLGDAAAILEEVSQLFGYKCPASANWSAADLRYEATKLGEGR
jgi:hypothetical protein